MTPILRLRLAAFLLLPSILIVPGLNTSIKAQNNPDRVYIGYTYIKTNPGKFEMYDSLLKNYTRPSLDVLVKDGSMYSWAIYEVLSPSGTKAEYDVVGVSVTNKIEMLLDPPMTNKDLMAKAFPKLSQKQRDDIFTKFVGCREIVKREIYTQVASTSENGPPTKTPAKYVQVDFMTPVAGKESDYVKMESETFKPVHLQRMKIGALEGWVLLGKILPGDTNDPAPFVTANFYNDLSQAMDGKYDEAVKAAYPNTDANKLFESTTASKKAQRIEIWKLMVADSKQAGTAAK